MGDKSPKAKQRDKSQKSAAKDATKAGVNQKQASFSSRVEEAKKKK